MHFKTKVIYLNLSDGSLRKGKPQINKKKQQLAMNRSVTPGHNLALLEVQVKGVNAIQG